MAKGEKKADIWMPVYIGDYLADTSRLTTEQHGAYFLLMMDYWRNGAPPDDDEILRNITKSSKFLWRKNRSVLEKYFQVSEGLWRHKRIDEERSLAKLGKEKASARGAKGAEARWGKDDAKSNAQGVLNQCPSPSPTPLPIKPTSKALVRGTRLPPDWRPNDEQISFVKKERPDLDAMVVADQFRDYWVAKSGAGGTKLDWTATWRNWVRNQRGQQKKNGSTYFDDRKSFLDELTGRNKGGNFDPDIIDI